MKAIEYCFPVVLFIILLDMVSTSQSVDEILRSDYSNEATEQYFLVVLFITLRKLVLIL